jgi:Xaa-Pro aminopeptidase
VVLPVNGPVVLVSDVSWWRADLVVADDIQAVSDVTAAVALELQRAGLRGRRVALVGAPFMTAAAYLGLVGAMGLTEFVRVDDFIERLRRQKTPADLEATRRALLLADEAMSLLMEHVAPGVTEAEAVAPALMVLERGGAVLIDAAVSSGPQAHRYAWARLPSRDASRPLRSGDMFHVDFYGSYGGYLWDFARTRVVGDDPTDEQAALLESALGAVDYVASSLRPGMRASDVYELGLSWLTESETTRSLGLESLSRTSYFGHGLGMTWEGPWLMPGADDLLCDGYPLSIELFLGRDSLGGVMYEQNGFITRHGLEVVTKAPSVWH